MGPLEAADIQRRRRRLLGSVSLLVVVFGTFSVAVSLVDVALFEPLKLTPLAVRLGVLVLTLAFVVLVWEKEGALRHLAELNERQQALMIAFRNRFDVLESLLQASDRLNAPLMVHDVLEVLLDTALDIAGADGGSVRATDVEEGDVIVARRHARAVEPSLATGDDALEVKLEIDGELVGVLALARPFRQDDALVRDVLGAFAERAARTLERAQVMASERASLAYLRAANIVKSRFLQTVSHELRTPLTSIIGYSRTLDSHWHRLDDETKLEFARSIHEQGGRLRLLVERILEAARVELEGVTVRPVDHDVRRSVRRALATFVHGDSERMELGLPEAPVRADIDPFVVEQAVTNLVDNALRYTRGPVRISLDGYKNSIVLAVSDEGPGMAAHDLELIAEPLLRVDENVRSGTGLGLHIVRTLVSDHGGWFEIRSGEWGTRVAVTLPREQGIVLLEPERPAASNGVK